jgi:trk system potassium uptake protein
MVLSLFAVVLMRQSVSVESHLLLSYMLSESRITDLAGSLKRIVLITFGVEAVGATLLFVFFSSLGGVADMPLQRLLMAVFHAVSAFCNAGFALFTTSLEQFHDHLGINLVISALIIAGGLSFAVLTNLYQWFRFDVIKRRQGRDTRYVPLTVNTRAVMAVTATLLLGGFLGFYALEMSNALAGYRTATQYLIAFFQSVTLRTAGFNTIPLGDLTTATYILMMALMFIGGAAGSTAGGLKVNNVAVILAFLDGRRHNRTETVLFGHTVSDRQTATAFSVLLFGILSVLGGTFLLALTETATLVEYLFETVSAFATVGLSTGLTPNLSVPGRLVVTILMFIGRVGPLTLLAASSGPPDRTQIRYPAAAISTG